jgi:putative SOS response-associated peptidase YedK
MAEKIDKPPTAMSSPDLSNGESGFETTLPQHGKVHYVARDQSGHLPEYEAELIPGYDANLMGARATLSSAEEKRLLRRIDWHLIPLLAVMYMLKSVDFTNVRFSHIRT